MVIFDFENIDVFQKITNAVVFVFKGVPRVGERLQPAVSVQYLTVTVEWSDPERNLDFGFEGRWGGMVVVFY